MKKLKHQHATPYSSNTYADAEEAQNKHTQAAGTFVGKG
jgi:hypothetical protein